MNLTIERIQTILSGIPLFKEIDENQLNLIAKNSREISLKKGECLFYKGDPSHGMYIVTSGWITIIFLSSEGKEHVVRIVGAGQTFGEAVMFIEKPYPGNAQANSDAQVLYIRKQTIFDCIENDPAFARRMIAGLSRRLHNLSVELESITLQSSQQRVINYLLHSEKGLDEGQTTVDVNLSVNKATIAAHLHLTPETLSRTLHSLSEKKLLYVDGKTIHIPDIGKLRKHADLDYSPSV